VEGFEGEAVVAEKLTTKQERFCQQYLIDGNATQSAIRAGYSEDTAGAIGFENLTKPEIQARLSELESDELKRLKITREKIYNELSAVAFARMPDFAVFDAGSLIVSDTADWTDDMKAAVLEMSESTNDARSSLKIKLHNKVGALEKLAQIEGMLLQKIDHTSRGEKINHVMVYLPSNGRDESPKTDN
jgi:phage terminase small subunit